MRSRWCLALLAAAAVAAAVGRPASADAPLDAHALYRAALGGMQRLTQPPFLTYDTTVGGSDGTLSVSRGDDGEAEIAVLGGASQSQSWHVAYRTSDGIASVSLADGTQVRSRLAIFDPTWTGAFAWLRHGLGASIAAPAASPPPEPSEPPQPGATAPPVVAVVQAIDERSYDVRDDGEAACADGRPGRRLVAIARRDPERHPLTRVVIDAQSRRFCAMRFHETIAGPTLAFSEEIELHFGAVGPYYLITGGTLNAAARPYRRPGWFSMSSSFVYGRFAFPASLPDGIFAER